METLRSFKIQTAKDMISFYPTRLIEDAFNQWTLNGE